MIIESGESFLGLVLERRIKGENFNHSSDCLKKLQQTTERCRKQSRSRDGLDIDESEPVEKEDNTTPEMVE